MKDKVDVMTYKPGCVDTNINPASVYGKFITTELAAKMCFRDLGHQPMSYGWIDHENDAWRE